MEMNLKSEAQNNIDIPKECAGCGKKITDSLERYWHESCLRCSCCQCCLAEVGSTLYTKASLILCKRDYLRLFGSTGYCAACCKVIPSFEMVMRARSNIYHLECFACQQCSHRFCIGENFAIFNNRILCEPDYQNLLMTISDDSSPPPPSTQTSSSFHNNNNIHSSTPSSSSTKQSTGIQSQQNQTLHRAGMVSY